MRTLVSTLVLTTMLAIGCSANSDSGDSGGDRHPSALASNLVTLTDFEFDGEVVAVDAATAKRAVTAQMFYLVGTLFPEKANARLDWLELSGTTAEDTDVGKTLLRYHAKIPVGWAKDKEMPSRYTLKLPRRLDEASLTAFYAKYGKACIADDAEGPDAESFWHDYAPAKDGCTLDDADVVTSIAKVTKSTHNTSGAYPEYDRIWADEKLVIVSVFGKDSPGSTSASDSGALEYNRFVSLMRGALADVKTTPETVPESPGVAVPDVTIEGTLPDGSKVKAVAMIIDGASAADDAFDRRFAEITKDADFVAYNGHSGLSKNTRAIAKKGTMARGQYQIWFFEGCNSFAYLDQTLTTRRAAANAPDDPEGTKLMDVVSNVLPSFFGTNANADLVLVKALMDRANPKTYNQIFEQIDDRQEVVVTGEEDNTFAP